MFKYLIINLVLAVISYTYYKIKNYKDIGGRVLIILFLPFIGFILLAFLGILEKYLPYNRENLNKLQYADKEKSSFFLKKLDVEKEINIIPIRDALAINSNRIKRRSVIDVLKGDTYDFLGVLTEAVKDKDTETSHYAATAITEMRRNFTLSLQKMEADLARGKTEPEFLLEYVDALKRYINSGLLDEKSIIKHAGMLSEVLTSIIDSGMSFEHIFEEKINNEIYLKNYQEALTYCKRYMSAFKKSERPLLLSMKTYFIIGDKKNFNAALSQLRKSKISISYETLDIVRFWIERT